MNNPIQSPLLRLQHKHAKRRLLEAVVQLMSGVGVAAMLGTALWAWSPAAALVTGIGVGVLSMARTRQVHAASRRTLDEVARIVDAGGQTNDLIRTALCIVTDRSVGSEALAAAIVEDAVNVLPSVAHHADRPFILPRIFPLAIAVMGALWFVPRPGFLPELESVQTVSQSTTDAPDLPPPTLRSAQSEGRTTPLPTPEASSQVSALGSGRDRQSSGGADASTDQGTSGGAGDRAADGEVSAGRADGTPTEGSGRSSTAARDAGTSGADARSASSTARPPPAAAARAPDPSDGLPAAPPGRSEDGNTTGMVDQTAAEQDAVQSDAEIIHLGDDVPDDRDAQTRDVAGTLDVRGSRPQFFDAAEESDTEENGKGGAGGWTIGLSQTGAGGINDASGSTWKTEAGLQEPPDWSHAPTEWVDAAWQDSPAGVVRRVKNGQAGGAGTAAYAAAWHRYAAVAEADSTTAALAPGRRALVQQYFLAIAPTESP